MDDGVRIIFEDLRARGARAVEAGRFEEAETLLSRALAIAQEAGDSHLIDLAFCNRAAVAIETGQGAAELPRSREILMRNADPVSCRLSAYNIGRFYELQRSYKKALFYARIALERSQLLGRRDWLASSHNLIGNTLLAESHVEQATHEYELALELLPAEPSLDRAMVLDNLGYCRVLQGRYRDGFTLLYDSLRRLRRFRAEDETEAIVRLDLCFAHLEIGRCSHALRHGLRALRIAEGLSNPLPLKNALYLLGQAESLHGRPATARGYFTRLQRQFFADASYLPRFLLAVDVRKLVNLHA